MFHKRPCSTEPRCQPARGLAAAHWWRCVTTWSWWYTVSPESASQLSAKVTTVLLSFPQHKCTNALLCSICSSDISLMLPRMNYCCSRLGLCSQTCFQGAWNRSKLKCFFEGALRQRIYWFLPITSGVCAVQGKNVLCVNLLLCSRLYLNMRISTVVNQMLWGGFSWRGPLIKH